MLKCVQKVIGFGFDFEVDFWLIFDSFSTQNSAPNRSKNQSQNDVIFEHNFAPFWVGFGSQNGSQNRPKEAQDDATTLSKWWKLGSCCNRALKMPPGTPKVPQMDPKWTPNGPKMDPKWSQNGPKMVLRGFRSPIYTSRYTKSDPNQRKSKKTIPN